MRFFFLLSMLYLLIVTLYLAGVPSSLGPLVKAKFETTLNESIQKAIDSNTVNGECIIARDKLSDNKCLSIDQQKAIKVAALDAQAVFPIDPGILNTTLSICNPRKGNCF